MIEQVTVTIKNQDFVVKKSNRALIYFEEMTGRSVYEMVGHGDVCKSFWCVLRASNINTFKYTFDEFLLILDEDETLLTIYLEYIQGEALKIFDEVNDAVEDKKKV